MVSTVRQALGSGPRLRLDANGTDDSTGAAEPAGDGRVHIDFIEQPIRDHPIGQLAEVRARIDTAVCANEGLWSEAEAYARIRARDADVIASLRTGRIDRSFHRLSWVAAHEGLLVCKHTHGSSVSLRRPHHVVLTLPNGVEGHQQTAYLMEHDILTEPIPIASGPHWGAIDGRPGRGRRREAVAEAAARFQIGAIRPGRAPIAKEAMTTGRLENKVALVVGGGSGMGRAGATRRRKARR
jgi:L-alanine-DL-glutamate epimerase-like enolase superfamily enzyme